MDSVERNPNESQLPDESIVHAIARLERRLDRIQRLIDEGIGAYLNAKFPYGKPTDRWRRR